MRRKWGYFVSQEGTRSTPPAHRTRLFRPTTALPTTPVGVPATPWMWAKARSKLGALVRLCGDGAVSNEAKMGSLFILHGKSTPPAHRTGLFRPTTALPTPPVGVFASPWMWAKARSKLGALVRLCGDGAVSNEAKMGSLFCFARGNKKHPSCTQNRAVPTHHRTPDAPRWRSRHALDVGEGQKQTRCIGSPVRRRGGVE
jgi:hypothetical protein